MGPFMTLANCHHTKKQHICLLLWPQLADELHSHQAILLKHDARSILGR